ncbi:uncharacterized protein LOC133784499 [Humulus lupulus]|uniref:uncharacterized protein LOC133784499 n=1 Tax=Humulus lupulus TaxID=3486 RepID=UPI002B404338|nr:uncharacterized protein LOC133784499 [Humulus lupulus]
MLCSDVMSRIGQSFSSLEAPQWQYLNNARDCTALYEKSIELATASLAFTAQLNYRLNNEIHSSKSYAQEAKDFQLKASGDLKAENDKLEAGAEELKAKASELEKLNTRLAELEKENARLAELDKENARLQEDNKKLQEDQAATFDIIEGEKARLLAEYKEKKDQAVDSPMYRMWANNEDLDTSFLGHLEAKLLDEWNARLEVEEAAREAASEGAQEDSHAIRPEGSSAADAEKAKENPPS